MADTTARFALPLLAAGQAQKEVFHNEALTLVDALVQPIVEAVALDDPPAAPQPGQCWVVGMSPAGAWSGRAGALACWTEGGWRFLPPARGMRAWSLADGAWAMFDATAWRIGDIAGKRLLVDGVQVIGPQAAGIADPQGGATIDVAARDTLSAILLMLREHGLIAS